MERRRRQRIELIYMKTLYYHHRRRRRHLGVCVTNIIIVILYIGDSTGKSRVVAYKGIYRYSGCNDIIAENIIGEYNIGIIVYRIVIHNIYAYIYGFIWKSAQLK